MVGRRYRGLQVRGTRRFTAATKLSKAELTAATKVSKAVICL